MTTMDRKQKEAVAGILIENAGMLVEFWTERVKHSLFADDLAEVDARQAADLIGKWLVRLPGTTWHQALTDPADHDG